MSGVIETGAPDHDDDLVLQTVASIMTWFTVHGQKDRALSTEVPILQSAILTLRTEIDRGRRRGEAFNRGTRLLNVLAG